MKNIFYKIKMLWNRVFKNEILLYAVIAKDDFKSGIQRYYTITGNADDAFEYVVTSYSSVNIHYIQWCELHNLDYLQYSSMIEYFKNCDYGIECDYIVVPLVTDVDQVATLMRVANQCLPLGCSYESEKEFEIFEKMSDEVDNLEN